MVERDINNQDQNLIQGFDFGKTDLATNMQSVVSSRFLGVDVDPATKRFFDVVLNQFLPHIANKVEKHGVGFIKDLALSSGAAENEVKALQMGKKYAPHLALATVLAEPIISVAATGYDATNRINNLRIALTPISKGSGTKASMDALFGSDNEVVQNARAHIYDHLYTDIAGTLARTVVTLPAVFAVRSRTKERLKAQNDEVELELAMKDPEARTKYIQDRIKTGTGLHQSLEAEKLKEIKTMRTAYEKEYKTYADSNDGKKTREEIVKRLSDDAEFARDAGVGHLFFGRETDGRFTGEAKVKKDALRKRSSFLKDNPEVNRAIDKELKYRFVEDEKGGKAFDDSWVKKDRSRYDRRDDKGYTTVVDGVEHVYKEMLDSMLGKQKLAEAELKANKSDSDQISIFDQMLMGAASLAGNQFHKFMVGNKQKDLNKPTALDLILHMRKIIHEDKKEHHQTETIANFGEESGDSSFTKFVHKVFEQHQLDCKKSEVGSRYFEHFKEAGFRDEDIFKIEDKDLSAYEVAVKHIARAIKEGQMDSIALVNLVGQRAIVQKDAKHFGPKGSNGVPSAIVAEVNKQCASNAAHTEVSQEQISEFLSNIVFSADELKAGFAANGTFKGDEKSFLFVLLESQVQDVNTMQDLTGLTIPEMEHLRTQAHSKFNEHFDAAINAVSAMSEKDIEALAKYDITSQEIQSIREAAESAQAEGKSVNDTITGEDSKQLKTAVANVIMAEEQEGKNFWQDRVKAKATEALNSSVSEALQTEASESATARLAKRDRKNESSKGDYPLGVAP